MLEGLGFDGAVVVEVALVVARNAPPGIANGRKGLGAELAAGCCLH